MRLALVRDGVVENVIEADAGFQPSDGSTVIPAINAGPGWFYQDGVFMPPAPAPEPVPQSVPLDRARAVLRLLPGRQEGQTMFDEANALVAASGNVVLTEFWERGAEIHRNSPTLAALAAALGLSAEALDDLFRQAAKLTL